MNRRGFLKRTGVTAVGLAVAPTVAVKEICTPVPVESFSPIKVKIDELTNELFEIWDKKSISEFLMGIGLDSKPKGILNQI